VPDAFTLPTLIGIKDASPIFFIATGVGPEVVISISPPVPTYNKNALGDGLG